MPYEAADVDTATHSSHSRRVLIVDDERELLEGITMAFEGSGHHVVPCRTFEEARDRLLAEDFDCLVTDVRLGAFNGLQLAVIARNKNPKVGLVVFSGFDDPVLREEAAHLGAVYMVKPVTVERLLDSVNNC